MIVRTWHGRASTAQSSAYPEHFRRHVLPELERIDGFLGASLLQQSRAEEIEFLVLTRWESMDAIRAFAGEQVETAVVEPDAAAALTSCDGTVQHYEVVEDRSKPVLMNSIGV
jgi:heme-degrading monooxygenase HmoA